MTIYTKRMKALFCFICIASSYIAVSPVAIADDREYLLAKTAGGETVRVIVKFRHDETPVQKQAFSVVDPFDITQRLLASRGLDADKLLPLSNGAAYAVTQADLQVLASHDDVVGIYEDTAEKPLLTEAIALIGADGVHDFGFVGSNQAIVIIDTGIDRQHEFMGSRVIAGACFSNNQSHVYQGRSANARSLCPDVPLHAIDQGQDCAWTGAAGCEHGTMVAGIAAGSANKSDAGLVGVAPGAPLISVQAFTALHRSEPECQNTNDSDSNHGQHCIRSFISDQLLALEWVVNAANTYDIAAVNMSVGHGKKRGTCDADPRADLIKILRQRGIATVVAAGNDGFKDAVSFPACISSAITVGMSDPRSSDEVISESSNLSEVVDLLAPGVGIQTSTLCPESTGQCKQYAVGSGTSLAAPFVSGAIALLKSVNPFASVEAIESALEKYGVPVSDTQGRRFPRVDVQAAFEDLLHKPFVHLDSHRYSVRAGERLVFNTQNSGNPYPGLMSFYAEFGDGVVQYNHLTEFSHLYARKGRYTLRVSASNDVKVSDTVEAKVMVYEPLDTMIPITDVALF